MPNRINSGANSGVRQTGERPARPSAPAPAPSSPTNGWASKGTNERRRVTGSPLPNLGNGAPRPSAPAAQPAAPKTVAATAARTPPVVQHSWYDRLNAAADSLGQSMKSAGASFTKAAESLGPSSLLGMEAKALGMASTAFGNGVANMPEASVVVASAVQERAVGLATQGQKLYGAARSQVQQGVKLAGEGVKALGDAEQALVNGVKDYAHNVAHAVDYKQNIDQLGKGDSYKLGLDGYAGVEGLRAAGKGSIEVSRGEDGKYTVALDGEIAGGLYGEVGGNVMGLKASGEASAMLGVGGTMELKFESKEEATKAAGILLKRASLMGASVALPPGLNLAAASLAAPTADELKFLGQHLNAVEFKGNVAAEAMGVLGIKGAAGLMGSVEGKTEASVKVEFGEGAPTLTVKQQLSAGLAGGAGIVFEGKESHGHEASSGNASFVGGSAEMEVSLEQKYALPKGMTLEAFKKDPLQQLKAVAGQMKKSQTDSVTFGFETKGGLMGSGGGVGGEFKVQANVDQLAKSGAIQKALTGDLRGALGSLPESTEVEGKLERFSDKGVQLGPMISVMGFGVGLEMTANRHDVDEARTQKYHRPLKDAVPEMAAWLRGAPAPARARTEGHH